jgi:hypothetical protein
MARKIFHDKWSIFRHDYMLMMMVTRIIGNDLALLLRMEHDTNESWRVGLDPGVELREAGLWRPLQKSRNGILVGGIAVDPILTSGIEHQAEMILDLQV